ncbi:RIP metalloprotease RseP [Marinomonas agarivorans]|nr:RIP metalloprotease RseP [Marinomonas agarivorans]
MIQNVFAIIVALGVLITFHEFGHYYVARRCGIKVLRFSVGFGKPIYTYVNKAGTEFTLALIPLGGYVRMLDEREGEVPTELKSQAFNNKNVWQRIAVVAAGPIANLLLAVVLYALVAWQGIQQVSPVIGVPLADSPIAETRLADGDELLAINGIQVDSWQQVNLALASLIGSSGDISIRYLPQGASTTPIEDSVTLQNWLSGSEPNNLIAQFGLTIKQPSMPAIIDDLIENGAALEAGFQIGDKIVRVDNQTIDDWRQFVDLVQTNPLKPLDVTIIRGEETRRLNLVPRERLQDGIALGYVGIMVAPVKLDSSWYRTVEYGPIDGLIYGVEKTGQMMSLTLGSIAKMLQGLISIDNLSGPITIAKVASASAESGLQSFLQFLAYLSISLGVLNLLPIPVLDGGHLVFYILEAVRGKPVPEKVQFFAYRIGASLLFFLMAIAIFNDIARL